MKYITITIPINFINKIKKIIFNLISSEKNILIISIFFSITTIILSFYKDIIIAYGDAESHLNIAKRVVHSLTPGLAQLGGIWLPLPHILIVPFVYFDFLWRTGLAGSIVSGISFVISTIIIYKLTYLFSQNKTSAFIAALVFITNPNILYMQTTPMTELTLIAFCFLSIYFFIKYLYFENSLASLIFSAFFGFCATLSRYDGWFLVLFEAVIIFIKSLREKKWSEAEGKTITFSTLAFLGIALWMLWDALILFDPFYFTNSQFSAKSQQLVWLSKGQLPAYHNIFQSVLYYTVTWMSNNGVLLFFIAIIGLIYFIKSNIKYKFSLLILLFTPFIFNVLTLFLGQSVIFIPNLTPSTFEWRLFNVRYGLMMIPTASILLGYLFTSVKKTMKFIIIILFCIQFLLYAIGYSPIISYTDGISGLSSAKKPNAEVWMKKNYEKGLVLIDNYTRPISIIRSGIPMQNIIYIGNKPYWEESLKEPEKYATWIVMQKNDDVWKNIYEKSNIRGRLYKYFKKVYTSPEILIFKKND